MWLKRPLPTIITISLLLCLVVGLALAADSDLTHSLVSSGGGTMQQAGIRLQSSIGQPVVGTVSREVTLCSGFQCGPGVAAEDYEVYLPLVLRP